MNIKLTTMVLLALCGTMLTTTGSSEVPDSLKLRIDSLKLVASTSDGLQKYQADFQIAYDLFDIDNSIAVSHAELAYQVAVLLSDTAKVVRSGRLYGQLLRRVSRLDEAVEIFLKVLPLSEGMRDNVEKGRILNALGGTYALQAKFDKALVYNIKRFHLMQTIGDSVAMSISNGNIGFIYYLMGNHKEAVSYFEAAIAARDSSTLSLELLNLALAKLHLNDLVSFPKLARKGLSLAQNLERKLVLAAYEFGFGLYYQKSGVIDSAELHYRRSLAVSRSLADSRGIAESTMRIAQCIALRGNLDSAISILRAVERDLARLKYNNVRMTCYEYLSATLETKGRWREALKYKSMQFSLSDSLFSQNIINNIAVARVEFEARENELLIQNQAQVIELRESEIERQRWLIAATVVLACLLTGFVFLLFRFVRLQRSISRELDRKVFERTRELKTSEDMLLKSLGEQRAVMDLVSRRVRSSIASFRGLMQVNHAEQIDSEVVNDRFEEAANELLQVSRIVDRSIEIR